MSDRRISKSLKKSIEYFEAHRGELVQSNHEDYVAIADGKIIGFFPDVESAYFEAIKTAKPGDFLLRKCLTKEEEPKKVLRSRAA